MLESIYNLALFLLAAFGAGRFGVWVVGQGWRRWWKAIAFLVAAAAVWYFLRELGGGPKTDLRILTEILATAGLVFGLQFAFRHVRNGWGQFGLIVAAGIFLIVTWGDVLDQAMGTTSVVTPAVTLPGIPEIPPIPPSNPQKPHYEIRQRTDLPPQIEEGGRTDEELCAQRLLSYDTCHALGYK